MRGIELDSAHGARLRQQLLETARTAPGVEHASQQFTLPFRNTAVADIHVAGIDSTERLGQFDLNAVASDYFATMGTRIVRGRGILDRDQAGAPKAVVVSEAMAQALWPGKDAMGQCVRLG